MLYCRARGLETHVLVLRSPSELSMGVSSLATTAVKEAGRRTKRALPRLVQQVRRPVAPRDGDLDRKREEALLGER